MLALTLLSCCLIAADPYPELRFTRNEPDGPWRIEASGLSPKLAERLKAAQTWTADEWATVLKVTLAGGAEDQPPLLGSYAVENGKLTFAPRFPLAPGVKYLATLIDGPNRVVKEFDVPKPQTEPPTITAVYPSGDSVPENLLRLYIHFSQPMARGNVYRYIRLINDTDKKDVELPFLELDEELWTADQTRFTLLIDPGRIKREVTPLEELGPALEEGKRFTLAIAQDWPDANGTKLKTEFRKTFTVTAPDRTPIDPDKWLIAPPVGNGPVIVTLDKAIDHALAQRMIRLEDPEGALLLGSVEVTDGERKLRFPAPRGGWSKGRYKLLIDTRLEDVCGNRVGEPFEVDIFKPVERSIETEIVTREFMVK